MSTPFEQWLADQNYRPSTIRRTEQELRRARREFMEQDAITVGHTTHVSLARFLTYAQTESPEALGDGHHEFVEALTAAGVTPAKVRVREKRQARSRVSFPDEAWALLASRLRELRHREADVLWLMARTSLRIGDVLPLERAGLEKGLKDGRFVVERKGGDEITLPLDGAADAWERLVEALRRDNHTGNLAGWVTGSQRSSTLAGDAAYQRVNRYLKKLGEELELPGRVHLHRIRRTLAVQALRLTQNTKSVQQLLGNKSHDATLEYVDEQQEEAVGRLQRKLGKFTK